MADDDEPRCKVEYLDVAEPEETNWIRRAGKCKVTYPNGHVFEGTYDGERVKQGAGTYIWMAPGGEEDETPVEKARFEGNYKDGAKTGFGKMVYPSGDVYEGEWVEDKMHGEGTYTYKASSDIYSGSWEANKKHGQGTYEYGADSSIMTGNWVEGQIVAGSWTLKGAAVYEGEFKLGRPFGNGKFAFASGLSQDGAYTVQKLAEGEEEEAVEDGQPPRPPNVAWRGNSIVSFSS